MALVKPGPLVSAISGNLGPINFRATSRGTVVARTAQKSHITTAPMDRQRSALASAKSEYADLTAAQKEAWRVYAQGLKKVNRLGIHSPMTGPQAYTSYRMLVTPYLDGGSPASTPPQYVRSETPVITSVQFTVSGPQPITAIRTYPFTSTEYLWITRHREYGPRVSVGQSIYIGNQTRATNTTYWLTLLTAAGVTFEHGEIVTARIYWLVADCFPSHATTWTVTVP